MNLEQLHGFGGGGSSTDNLLKSFEIADGQTLETGDVIEFVGNKIRKTEKRIDPDGGSPQVAFNLEDSVTFTHYVYKYADNKGILVTPHTYGVRDLALRTFEVIGTVVNIKQTFIPNVYGWLIGLTHIDSDKLILAVRGGSGVWVNNTANFWAIILRLENDTLSFVSAHVIPHPYMESTPTINSQISTLDIVVIAPNRFVVYGSAYLTSYRDFTSAHTLTDEGLISGPTLVLTGGPSQSRVDSKLIQMSDGRIYGLLTTMSSTKRFVQLDVSSDNVVTVLQDNQSIVPAGKPLSDGLNMFEIDPNTIAVCSSNSTDSMVSASVIKLDNDGQAISISANLRISSNLSNKVSTGFTLPDINDKTKILVKFVRSGSIYTFVLGVDPLAPSVSTLASDIWTGLSAHTVTDPGKYPLFDLGNNLSLSFYFTGSNKRYEANSIVISTFGETPLLASTIPHKPEGIVKTISDNIANVALENTILSGLSNLIPSYDYYSDENGNLTTEIADGAYPYIFVGKAISQTELLVYKLQKLTDINLRTRNNMRRQYQGTVSDNTVVKINTDGTISDYDGTGVPIGFHSTDGIVTLKGTVKGLSGLIFGNKYYFDSNGKLTDSDLGFYSLVGYALSDSELVIPEYIIKKFKGSVSV